MHVPVAINTVSASGPAVPSPLARMSTHTRAELEFLRSWYPSASATLFSSVMSSSGLGFQVLPPGLHSEEGMETRVLESISSS